uniref:ZP domain-containing protein n=1 Tax=Knipowitschia caucasica TaxID=637954 RepID=A0AAV2IXJ1_KNICA
MDAVFPRGEFIDTNFYRMRLSGSNSPDCSVYKLAWTNYTHLGIRIPMFGCGTKRVETEGSVYFLNRLVYGREAIRLECVNPTVHVAVLGHVPKPEATVTGQGNGPDPEASNTSNGNGTEEEDGSESEEKPEVPSGAGNSTIGANKWLDLWVVLPRLLVLFLLLFCFYDVCQTRRSEKRTKKNKREAKKDRGAKDEEPQQQFDVVDFV